MSRAEAAAFPAPWRVGRGSGRAGGRAGEPRPLRPEPPEPPRSSPALGRLRGHSLSCVSSGRRPRGLACPGIPPEQPGQRSPRGCGGRTIRVGIRERARCRLSVGQPGREEEGCAGRGGGGGGGCSSSNKRATAAPFLFSGHNQKGWWMASGSRDASRAWLGFNF